MRRVLVATLHLLQCGTAILSHAQGVSMTTGSLNRYLLSADDVGTGEPAVVFLHSLAGNGTHWVPQLDHLQRQRRAVALDWRGHGRSSVSPSGDYSIPTLAADVAETVDQLGLIRFFLIGHSAGASI